MSNQNYVNVFTNGRSIITTENSDLTPEWKKVFRQLKVGDAVRGEEISGTIANFKFDEDGAVTVGIQTGGGIVPDINILTLKKT